jgi:hypothetical protein
VHDNELFFSWKQCLPQPPKTLLSFQDRPCSTELRLMRNLSNENRNNKKYSFLDCDVMYRSGWSCHKSLDSYFRGVRPGYRLSLVLRGFPQSCWTNKTRVPWNRPRLLPSTSLQIYPSSRSYWQHRYIIHKEVTPCSLVDKYQQRFYWSLFRVKEVVEGRNIKLLRNIVIYRTTRGHNFYSHVRSRLNKE